MRSNLWAILQVAIPQQLVRMNAAAAADLPHQLSSEFVTAPQPLMLLQPKLCYHFLLSAATTVTLTQVEASIIAAAVKRRLDGLRHAPLNVGSSCSLQKSAHR